jgi:shikimate 5-dehydrogenase
VGLSRAGADVVLANRDAERGERAAEALKVPFVPLAGLDLGRFDLIVQATSLGRGEGDPLPFDIAPVGPGTVVIDLVYGEEPTPLLRAVTARGALGIDGREVLLYQALGQFRRMTGRELPTELGRSLLGLPPLVRAGAMGEEAR